MNDAPQNCSLVLIGRYPGRDVPVAQALARCMGREESWGLRIVSSAPITFFEKLAEKHARQIKSALEEVAEAGCRFEVQTGPNAGLPKVGWATPPKIHGRSLAEIAPGSDLHLAVPLPSNANMPAASATSPALLATVAAPPATASSAAMHAESGHQTRATLYIPCPYTGQKIKLSLQITLSRVDGGTAISIAAAASQASPRAPSGSVILPAASQPRQTGHIPLPRKSSQFANASSAALPAENIGWARNTPAEIPLPDVPILPTNARAQSKPGSTHDRQPLPLDSAPMDLSTFEASLGVSPHETVRPYLDPGPNVLDDTADPDEPHPDDPESETVLCSVFIERSSSPVVHELVAELHGIPETEAAEMCVSGSVALAENIPLYEANDIKRRCAAINVSARVVPQD